ncbi:MAG: TIGR01777 family oxidoreductase [Syntrophales bacterium]
MKIFMTGGTGFVGTYLTRHLIGEGHEVTVLTPELSGAEMQTAGLSYLIGHPAQKGPWQEAVAGHGAIVNLAGASIFSRWTPEYKQVLRSSRMETTRNLVEALPVRGSEGVVFFSTSAVGYYGFHDDEELVESSPPGSDFLALLARDWEAEARRAAAKGARVVITRFGIVLGKNGGALGQMIPLFRNFVGGPLGSGRQWFSWVHLHDLARAFSFLLNRRDASGPFNLCSPHPVRNRELGKALGSALHRPSLFPAPGFIIRLILGEFGDVLLKGQRVIPRALLDAGFTFRYPHIEEALHEVLFP